MKFKFVCALCVYLFFGKVFSQSTEMEKVLSQIEQNNKELKAYQSYINGQQLLNKSGNNLPNPEVLGYYLPFGEHQSDDYSEFEVSQSFEFPTVYLARNKWNKLQEDQLEAMYTKKRQEILLKAKEGLINLNMLRKRLEVEEVRKTQSQEVFQQIQELYNKEQVGILDLNKAKVAWIQEQFVVEQIQADIQNQLTELQTLNGGQSIEMNDLQLDSPVQLQSIETIWSEKLANDPRLTELQANEASAFQSVKLEKNKVLPNISLGYNYQGVNGNDYSGVFGGLSIPLWNSKNRVKAAKADFEYQQTNSEVTRALMYSQFQQEYNQYLLLFNKYTEYRETLSNLDSEVLLFKAYSLGEYSFLEYYMEVQFYRDATDRMLEMEKQLQQLQAQLLIHQL